jgi:hypothetical protein
LKTRNNFGDLNIAKRIKLKSIVKNYDRKPWNGLIWLRIRSSNRLL